MKLVRPRFHCFCCSFAFFLFEKKSAFFFFFFGAARVVDTHFPDLIPAKKLHFGFSRKRSFLQEKRKKVFTRDI
jgi:hypothetical protein